MSREGELVSIGYGGMVSAGRLIAMVEPGSAPVKRLITEARERGMLIDATFGRKTASVLVMDSDRPAAGEAGPALRRGPNGPGGGCVAYTISLRLQ